MSICAYSDRPAELLSRIRALISDGQITTWKCDPDGDFTHASFRWKNKAWLTPEIQGERVQFTIIGRNSGLSRELFAVYHGQFIEMLIAHAPDYFSAVSASPTATLGDSAPSEP